MCVCEFLKKKLIQILIWIIFYLELNLERNANNTESSNTVYLSFYLDVFNFFSAMFRSMFENLRNQYRHQVSWPTSPLPFLLSPGSSLLQQQFCNSFQTYIIKIAWSKLKRNCQEKRNLEEVEKIKVSRVVSNIHIFFFSTYINRLGFISERAEMFQRAKQPQTYWANPQGWWG